ncbi:MAG: hypothetical protein A3E83_04965 [Gammaproteobacteria bacterium RIFCSPHIGHO2_12_FULL_41_20]|nr:MAG: hypothetical protein A3E83_04965 [Gammaproteobacteria bacterium RIFCSPHIGHO2_12_FULL_41_20]
MYSFILSCIFVLSGCASSGVAREAASQVDQGYQHTQDMVSNVTDTRISDSYGNTSQATRGALIGGATGAVAGSLVSGIGVIPGAAEGAIFGAAYGSYIDQYTTSRDQLENRGVNMIVLGDQIRLVLSSEQLFHSMTATIRPQAYSILYMVARYINQYTTMSVTIAAYTDATGSARVRTVLSKDQASSIVKFLGAAGVNTRVLYGVGYGGRHLIAKNSTDWDTSDNYRIEITLEKLPV